MSPAADANVPGRQREQAEAWVSLEMRPAGHRRHPVLFDSGEYDPALQVVQVVTPDLGEKVPARQSLHVPLTGQTAWFQSVLRNLMHVSRAQIIAHLQRHVSCTYLKIRV